MTIIGGLSGGVCVYGCKALRTVAEWPCLAACSSPVSPPGCGVTMGLAWVSCPAQVDRQPGLLPQEQQKRGGAPADTCSSCAGCSTLLAL